MQVKTHILLPESRFCFAYRGEYIRTIEDGTPLDGGEIDVAARIGWIVRMARITAAEGDTRLSVIADRLGRSTAHVSRVETGMRRDGVVISGYERELQLVDGSLRAPVDMLCQTFPESPRDHAPGEPLTDVTEVSRLTEDLLSGAPVGGGAWLRWARELSRPGNLSLPVSIFLPLCRRLVDELARSVSHAHPTRYEALALLRRSAYGSLVLDVAREVVADPYAQCLGPLLRAVGERVDDDAVDWCFELLADPVDNRVRAAARALENMGTVDGAQAWHGLAPRLLDALGESTPGSLGEEWVAHLIRTVPRTVWHTLGLVPDRPLPQAPGVESSRDAAADAYKECVREADVIATALGVPPQPMLARLLYDVALGPWETRATTGHVLLGAVPTLATTITDLLAAWVEVLRPSPLRDRMARRMASMLNGEDVARTHDWLTHDDPVLRRLALIVAGEAGRSIHDRDLWACLLDEQTGMEAAYVAGMTDHPALAALAAEEVLDDATRGTLAWWVGRGGRITD